MSTLSGQMGDVYVSASRTQNLTTAQKTQARNNLGLTGSSGGPAPDYAGPTVAGVIKISDTSSLSITEGGLANVKIGEGLGRMADGTIYSRETYTAGNYARLSKSYQDAAEKAYRLALDAAEAAETARKAAEALLKDGSIGAPAGYGTLGSVQLYHQRGLEVDSAGGLVLAPATRSTIGGVTLSPEFIMYDGKLCIAPGILPAAATTTTPGIVQLSSGIKAGDGTVPTSGQIFEHVNKSAAANNIYSGSPYMPTGGAIFSFINKTALSSQIYSGSPYMPTGGAVYDYVRANSAVFIPSVSADGLLSWNNSNGLPNPPAVNVRGADGVPGTAVAQGATFTPACTSAGILSWTNNGSLPNPAPVDLSPLLGGGASLSQVNPVMLGGNTGYCPGALLSAGLWMITFQFGEHYHNTVYTGSFDWVAALGKRDKQAGSTGYETTPMQWLNGETTLVSGFAMFKDGNGNNTQAVPLRQYGYGSMGIIMSPYQTDPYSQAHSNYSIVQMTLIMRITDEYPRFAPNMHKFGQTEWYIRAVKLMD